MRHPCTDGREDVAAFVADDQFVKHPLVPGQQSLQPADVGVKFLACQVVSVVINPLEFDENGDPWAQFCQEISLTTHQPLVDRRQKPAASQLGIQVRGLRPRVFLDRFGQPGEDREMFT